MHLEKPKGKLVLSFVLNFVRQNKKNTEKMPFICSELQENTFKTPINDLIWIFFAINSICVYNI